MENTIDTKEIIAFLSSPNSYEHHPPSVHCHETHISWIFVAAPYVYKIKKAVAFDFLDFTTLEARRHFCNREFELNREISPELYLGVESVTQESEGSLAFNGKGTVVEYLVKMHSFDSGSLFTELIARGELLPSYVTQIACKIATFHQNQILAPKIKIPESLEKQIGDKIEVLKKCSWIEKSILEKLQGKFLYSIEQQRKLLSNRQPFFTKRIHGDLHLGNLCLFRGAPTIFDCIEFNDRLACGDPWVDIAFLLMDLSFRNRPDLSFLACNTYLQQTDDYEGVALVPLMIAYRALVRSMVAALSSEQHSENQTFKTTSLDYLSFALKAFEEKKPQIVVIGGLSGSGKTTLANELSQRIGALHLMSDAVRKHLYGVPLNQKAPLICYSDDASRHVYRGLLVRAEQAIKAGFSLVIDAKSQARAERKVWEKFANERALPFTGLWCEVPSELALERIRKRSNDFSDADELIRKKQELRPVKENDWKVVDMSKNLSSVVAEILNDLKNF